MYAKLGMRENALKQEQLALASGLDHNRMLFFTSKIRAILNERAEALNHLKEALASGFLMLQYLDYHRRSPMGLHNLDQDMEFQAVRDDLAKTVERLREKY